MIYDDNAERAYFPRPSSASIFIQRDRRAQDESSSLRNVETTAYELPTDRSSRRRLGLSRTAYKCRLSERATLSEVLVRVRKSMAFQAERSLSSEDDIDQRLSNCSEFFYSVFSVNREFADAVGNRNGKLVKAQRTSGPRDRW